MFFHGKSHLSVFLDGKSRSQIISSVVDLPLWKIWVRQIGSSSQVLGKKIKMFQTTNQWCLTCFRLTQIPKSRHCSWCSSGPNWFWTGKSAPANCHLPAVWNGWDMLKMSPRTTKNQLAWEFYTLNFSSAMPTVFLGESLVWNDQVCWNDQRRSFQKLHNEANILLECQLHTLGIYFSPKTFNWTCHSHLQNLQMAHMNLKNNINMKFHWIAHLFQFSWNLHQQLHPMGGQSIHVNTEGQIWS